MAHITIPDQDLAERYTVGGVATDTFSYAKKFINESDVSVYNGTSLIDPADYTITGTPDASGVGFDGASIVLDTPVTNTTITLILEAPNKRLTDFPTTGPFNIAQLNTELDQQVILTQQLQTELDRAFLLPIDTSLTRIVLPDPTANMAFGWDATAENIINLQSIGTYKGTDATITTSDYTARDLVKSTTAGELNNVYIALQDSPAGTLLTNGSYWALVVDAVSAATSATNAATSEANAATSESNAATSESNAATSASNAATQATNSANSATQAALSATNAGNSETNASASETAAATSETNAATSATQASTSAGNSATSATAASASETAAATSETAAATSETNAAASYAATVAIYGSTSDVQNAVDSATASATSASSSATNASNSATAAATSEANAATNATAAQTAQTAAEAAQAAAESAQEAIEGTYLGAHASDPTVDGNGDAVTTGDWYFNTTDSQAYIYNGSSWDALAPDLVGDATPQLGGDLDTNGNDITFGDNEKAIFGAGNDLQIYHTATGDHSVINESGGGDLRIQANKTVIQSASGADDFLVVTPSAGVQLSHNASGTVGVKLATTSTGIDVTGTVTADGLTVSSGATFDGGDTTIDFSLGTGRFTTPNAFVFTVDDDSNSDAQAIYFRSNAGQEVATFKENGDISFYEDTGTTAKLFWDASAERLGIGTTTPASDVDVIGAGGGNGEIQLSRTSGTTLLTQAQSALGKFGTTTNHNLQFMTNGGGRMTIDTNGQVGIGTTSPSARLHTDVTGGDNELRIATTTSGDPKLTLYANGAGAHAIAFDRSDLALTFTTVGASERMRIDSSGNVGIGTDSPSKLLDVDGDAEINGLTVGKGSGGVSTNTACGLLALNSNTTGNSNTANGRQALYLNETGSRNTASGYQALYTNDMGGFNTAYGYRSLYLNETGNSNTAAGMSALYTNTTGGNNTANGHSALYNNETGHGNTANGRQAIYLNETGNFNTGSGYLALGSLTTGSNNIGIGYTAGRSTSPSGAITTGSNIICLGDNSITDLYCADTSISSSDGRDKTDVENFTAGLDFVNKMRPVTYRWDKRTDYLDDENTDPLAIVPDGTHKRTKQHVGFISQEIEVLEQELGFATSKENQLFCNTNEDNTAMGIKYERLIPVLVNAIKELTAKVEALEANQ